MHSDATTGEPMHADVNLCRPHTKKHEQLACTDEPVQSAERTELHMHTGAMHRLKPHKNDAATHVEGARQSLKNRGTMGVTTMPTSARGFVKTEHHVSSAGSPMRIPSAHKPHVPDIFTMRR